MRREIELAYLILEVPDPATLDEFFGEVIGPLTLLGTVIIVGAGLFIFVRERRLHANQITQSATGG